MMFEFQRLSPRVSTLSTIAYADIFDYPMTGQELVAWAIQDKTTPYDVKGIERKKGFFFLKGRSYLVAKRIRRQQSQGAKWQIAKRAARWLSLIPTIQLVGVTGGLAMNNAGETDDIDLFLITAPNTMWISRLLAVLCMNAIGLRRKPLERNVINKICLNMFVSEERMGMLIKERDCFAAHEVLQMHPLWEQPGTYKQFLRFNYWVQPYLPNAWNLALQKQVAPADRTPALVIFVFQLLELPTKLLQLWYMSRHRTHEVITDTMLRFHPKDARRWVKRKLAIRLRRYNIPLDKIFYAS
jgi:hypothetical protein